MSKRALISVYDKEGILDLANFLTKTGWEIISTGGTAKHLLDNGFPVTDISSVTGFPECLDGRVKTLHPAVHGGLLARRDLPSHMETLNSLNLKTIDLVCVNLYPFFEKVESAHRGELSMEETIEFIDIGGPSMLRSAAKNFRDVIVLTNPADYDGCIKAMSEGEVPLVLRKSLAAKVFSLTSAYDGAIARYLLELDAPIEKPVADNSLPAREYPAYWPLSLTMGQPLRYGENGHQGAALYFSNGRPGALAGMEQHNGKELGYNNIRDLDLAWKAATAFGLPADGTKPVGEDEVLRHVPGWSVASNKRVSCVAVKHNTPCGIALGADLAEAYAKTFACDPVSIFGGIVATNTIVDAGTAEKLGELFLEIVVAPDFEPSALKILQKKKNLRIMKAPMAPKDYREYISVDGGLLVQESDKKLIDKWEVVTQAVPADEDMADLIFGLRAVTFVKSNAIMVIKDCAATGIGGGQVNRIWPTLQSLERSAAAIQAAQGQDSPWKISGPARVLASDAFFPFDDVVEAAAAAGIRAIIQPGGSINDKVSIEACNRHGIAMVFTGLRHFKH